jgi:cysteine synthase
MQTLAMSSENSVAMSAGSVAPRMRSLCGATPLLPYAGYPGVLLKLEGMQSGGSFFDRVVNAQLDRLPSGQTVVAGEGGAWAASLALLCADLGHPLELWLRREDQRTVELCRRFGATVRFVAEAEREAKLRDGENSGVTVLRRDDLDAHVVAYTAIADEVREQRRSSSPPLWVVATRSVPRDAITAALGTDPSQVAWVDEPEDGPSAVSDATQARRTMMGSRAGVLVGPTGARVVDAAVAATERAVSTDVVAIVPDGGHRYLGWW